MRLVFYKLPNASGENVVVTESYAFVESELAVLVDDADLDLPYFDLFSDGDQRTVTEVEEASENVDPYMIVDSSLVVEGTLPFTDREEANRFLDTVIKWQKYINKAYDE